MPSKVQPITSEPLEEKVTLRGVTYRFRELTIGEYDDLVRKATTPRTNQITGATEEDIDNAVLLKMMVGKCMVEPKLTPAEIAALPTRVTFKINGIVNRMHYGDEPEGKDGEDGDADDGEAKGNA